MTGRKCGTCKHFEPAPIWRKGWCRNPLLYAPQQSHLVSEEDLDCERGMGNYWELSSSVDLDATVGVEPAPVERTVIPMQLIPPLDTGAPSVSQTGQQIFPVTGSSGYSNDPSGSDLPPGGGRGGGDRQFTYYSEDRYWTDYLRIAAPILGVILMVVLFWLWASSFLGDDDDDDTGNINGTSTIPTIGATAPASPTGAAGTSTVIVISTAPPQGTTPTGPAPTATTPPDTGPEIFNGATVQIANTGGAGVNLRTEATTSSEIIDTLLDGTVLTVSGEAVDAEDFRWWPVTTETGAAGWVVEDYLQLVE
jgi:hypothetical protein